MTNQKIRDIIKDWQFATCPTEEKEPFFWKWNEHGLEMLAIYIQEALAQREQEIKEKILVIKKEQGFVEDYGGKDFSPIREKKGYIQALNEVLQIIKGDE